MFFVSFLLLLFLGFFNLFNLKCLICSFVFVGYIHASTCMYVGICMYVSYVRMYVYV